MGSKAARLNEVDDDYIQTELDEEKADIEVALHRKAVVINVENIPTTPTLQTSSVRNVVALNKLKLLNISMAKQMIWSINVVFYVTIHITSVPYISYQ